MNHLLRHYHLGCGQRLQTDFSDFKSVLRVKFKEINEKICTKRNEKRKLRSENPASGKVR